MSAAPSPDTIRHRRLGLLLAVGLVAPFQIIDHLVGRASRASLLLQLAWLAVLAVAALFQSARRPKAADAAARLAGFLTGALFSLIIFVTGGSASPYFAYTLVIPSSALVLLHDIPSAAALAIVGTIGGGIAILVHEGKGWGHVAAWSYLGLASSLLTGVGAWFYMRLSRAEARAQCDRADAATAMAERERAQERELAAANEQATRSRDQLRKILENMPDIVIVSRFDGSIAFVNGRGHQMFGSDPVAKAAGMSVFDRLLPEDRPILLRRREAFAAGQDAGTDIVRVTTARGVRECEISGTRVEFDGAPAVVTSVRDVTERRELERRLTLADRMASIGTLAAGVAHEINNPLSYVLSNLRFLSSELARAGGGPDAAEAATDALAGAERVHRILRDLNEFTRPNDEQGPVDVAQVFDLAANIASNELRFRAKLVKVYGDVPPARGDESRLGQVALNLLINAAHAIPEGRPDENEIRVLTRTGPGGRVLMEVRDTGRGIEPAIRSRIFEPFFTTKPVGVGTGLGLSVCHEIVRSLGGEISVESEVGKGSVFRVVLPAHEAEPPPAGHDAAAVRDGRRT